MLTRLPRLRPSKAKKDKTFFHRQQFNKLRKSDFNPSDTPQPFTVSKIVFVGASVVDRCAGSTSTQRFCASYIKSVYGDDVEIVERATPGYDVNDVAAVIDGIVAEFSAEPDTHFLTMIGANDIGAGNYNWDDVSDIDKAQKEADLRYVYDAITNDGKIFIPASIPLFNYNENTVDDVPQPKVNELGGSYTFNRDWIAPVSAEYVPQYIDSSGFPFIDLYNPVRNNYVAWATLAGDVVHPSEWGRILFMYSAVDRFMKLSKGTTPEAALERDFTIPSPAGSEIDVVMGFGHTTTINAGTTNANITWATRLSNNTATPYDVALTDCIDVNGVPTKVSVYSQMYSAYSTIAGNVADPTNDTSTLMNNLLLSTSGRGYPAGDYMWYFVIKGLDPLSEYTVETVGSRTTSTAVDERYIQSNVSVDVATGTENPESAVTSSVVTTDHEGNVFIGILSITSVLSGIRVKSNG